VVTWKRWLGTVAWRTPSTIRLSPREIHNRLVMALNRHESAHAFLASRYQKPQSRVTMQLVRPFRTADADAFQEHPEVRRGLVKLGRHLAEGFRLTFRKVPLAVHAVKAQVTVAV
jgi:hypothetical protein